MEAVKFIIRSVTVVIVISLYFAGWVFYVRICSKDHDYDDAAVIFYAIWTTLHIIAMVIGFVWAWM